MQQRRPQSRVIVGFLSLGLLVGVALTAHPAQAVDAIGPYYAVPSWDQKKAPANRFVVLTNWASAAVLDKETGLVWEQSPLTTLHPWDYSAGFLPSALTQCMSRTTGGRKGWRLPSVHELASLMDPTKSNPSLPTGHPFTNVQSADYWSATTVATNRLFAWTVNFGLGTAYHHAEADTLHAWCVRGGMNADAY